MDPRRIAEALRRYARREPPAAAVVRVALAVSARDPDRARALASRARMSGWVPTLRVGARRGRGWDASELVTEDSGRTNLSTDDELTLSAWLTFRLDRLVFAREETALLREERAIEEARAAFVQLILGLYFERRRLQLERDLLDVSRLEQELRIQEATALLNAFTGGAFERMIRRR